MTDTENTEAHPIDEYFEKLHGWGESVDERLDALEAKVDQIRRDMQIEGTGI